MGLVAGREYFFSDRKRCRLEIAFFFEERRGTFAPFKPHVLWRIGQINHGGTEGTEIVLRSGRTS
jgi:hypothetical protein